MLVVDTLGRGSLGMCSEALATPEKVVAGRRPPGHVRGSRSFCWPPRPPKLTEIQSREARGEATITLGVPCVVPPDGPPLSGLDYAHSGGPRSRPITRVLLVICTDFTDFSNSYY